MLISESFSRWRKHRSCDIHVDNVNEVNICRKNKKKQTSEQRATATAKDRMLNSLS